jgi:hypothetical protein
VIDHGRHSRGLTMNCHPFVQHSNWVNPPTWPNQLGILPDAVELRTS